MWIRTDTRNHPKSNWNICWKSSAYRLKFIKFPNGHAMRNSFATVSYWNNLPRIEMATTTYPSRTTTSIDPKTTCEGNEIEPNSHRKWLWLIVFEPFLQSESSYTGTFESNGRHIHLFGVATTHRFRNMAGDKCHLFESIDWAYGRFTTYNIGTWHTFGHINHSLNESDRIHSFFRYL